MILVGGCMRSGTSVVQSVLCSTEQTNPVIPECDFLIELAALYKRNVELFGPRNLNAYFGEPVALREFMGECIRQFLASVGRLYPAAGQLVLKNPEMTVLFPLLYQLLPETKFVVTVRDPRDTIVSMLKVNQRYREKGVAPPIDFQDDAAVAAGYLNAIYAPIFAAMEGSEDFKAATCFVKYEELCERPEEVARRLSGFSGLDLSAYSPSAGWNSTVVYTNDSPWNSDGYGKTISTSTIGYFKSQLSAGQVETVERECRAIMTRFGYRASSAEL
jgi:hypothetical protein